MEERTLIEPRLLVPKPLIRKAFHPNPTRNPYVVIPTYIWLKFLPYISVFLPTPKELWCNSAQITHFPKGKPLGINPRKGAKLVSHPRHTPKITYYLVSAALLESGVRHPTLINFPIVSTSYNSDWTSVTLAPRIQKDLEQRLKFMKVDGVIITRQTKEYLEDMFHVPANEFQHYKEPGPKTSPNWLTLDEWQQIAQNILTNTKNFEKLSRPQLQCQIECIRRLLTPAQETP
jgi:hypothetical protein